MRPLDWILALLLLGAVVRGWRLGVIKQVVSIAGIILGLVAAKMFCGVVGEALSPHVGDNMGLASGIAFVAIWVLVPAVLGLLGELVSTILDKIIIVGQVNKILGALFSLLKYAFLLGAIIWALARTRLLPAEILTESFMGVMLKAFSEAFYTSFINA